MKSKMKLIVFIICAVPFIMVLGNSMLIPVLPKIKDVLHLSQVQVSLLITLFSIPAGIIIPIAGFLSDRFGRKAIIVPGLILYGLGGVIAGFSALLLKNPYLPILAGRIFQGIGAAGTAPIAMALVSDIFISKERSKVLGLTETANGFGKVTSPILGSLVSLIAWYATLLVFPILTLPIAAGMWLLVKEPASQKKPPGLRQYLQTIGKIFTKKASTLLTSFLAGMVALFILFGVLFYLSDFLEKTLKIDGVIKGLVLAIPVLFMSIMSYITGLILQKKTNLLKLLIILGLANLSWPLLLVPFFKNPYYLLVLLIISSIGTGLVLPALNTLITSSTAMAERGLVTSLYGSVRFFGVALGPPVVGWLMGRGTFTLFLGVAGLGIVVGLLALFLIKISPVKKTKPQEESAAPQTPSLRIPLLLEKFFTVATLRPQLARFVLQKPLKTPQREDKGGA